MYLNFLYVGALGVLILLFLDSIREMNKFGKVAGEKFVQHEQELDRHMKMFRSQRNFYIVGFALFLFV
jgi:B-cell receptor-associated protein 31